uniref:Stc1 domain-containing protein n=1 Tax=Macrostomum lignano TaxID=282301 RepID=A0A1I8FG95_9PLAT
MSKPVRHLSKPARINQICSAGLLTGCSCPEMTKTAPDEETKMMRNNCPGTNKDAIGFCTYDLGLASATARLVSRVLLQLVANSNTEGCPVCVCQQDPPEPLTHAASASAARRLRILRYASGESRDDRGCVRDCSCRCRLPDSCESWPALEIDRFGCQLCSACSGGSRSHSAAQQSAASQPCITKSRPPAAQRHGTRLCPSNCPPQQFSISEDSNSGCLTHAHGAGAIRSEQLLKQLRRPHGHLRDSLGCLLPGCACATAADLNQCISSCVQAGNFTVAKDAYASRCPAKRAAPEAAAITDLKLMRPPGARSAADAAAPTGAAAASTAAGRTPSLRHLRMRHGQ